MLGRLGANTPQEVEIARLRNITAQKNASVAATSGQTWSKWAPFLVVGGIAVVGVIALAVRARRKKS